MKKILFLILLPLLSIGQKVVDDFDSVKKPKHGKLYFSQKQNRLSIYTGSTFQAIVEVESDTTKPIPPNKETTIGYWGSTDRILVAYAIEEGIWLMQKDPSGSYYVARGRNLLDDPRTVISGTIDKNTISGGDTDVGGLYAPSSFPESVFLKETGRIKNANGEYVYQSGGGGDKISKPVGVIRWDGYFTTLTPDDPIDITKETRYALSDQRTQDQAPFYSFFHQDEVINKQKWNGETKQWEWRPVTVNVRFNGDRAGVMEKEVEYAVNAGIDYFLFNYYANGATPMAIARQQFEALPDKKGLKAAYIMENIGGDPQSEARLIANAFRQEWYQKIDDKPILVLPAGGSADFDRVYGIFTTIKSVYGGEIYAILQMMGHPVEMATEIRKRGYNSHTRYMTWGGWNEGDRSHRYIMNKEWEWYQQATQQSVDFTPNVTTSFYQVGAQKSWDLNPDYSYSEKATDAEFEEQISRLAKYINGSSQTKTAIIYSWSEFTEGGRTVCPQLRRDGSVDDRILRILSKYLD